MATELLRNRLDAIRARRAADPTVSDPTPTLLDIERTHVLFTNSHFKPFVAIGYEYNKVNANSGNVQLGNDVQFSIPQFGDFFSDMVLYVQLSAPVLVSSDTGANAPTNRWCDWIGERFLKKVSFDVNGNPLDQYTPESANMYRKFRVQPNKLTAWMRCMGQEEAKQGYMNPDETGSPDGHRVLVNVTNSNQTPMATQNAVNLFIPLLFWCNLDPRLAIPSVAIPYGQRFITLSLATQTDLLAYQLRGAGLAANISTWQAPSIVNMNLYINNIFVNPEIHKVFIKRIGFSLIRVNRIQITPLNTPAADTLMQNLKWPIETMFIGFRPTVNKTDVRNWHRYSQVATSVFTMPQLVTKATTATVTPTALSPTVTPVVFTFAQANMTAYVDTPCVDTITVTAHGIYLYNALPAAFFNAYTPATYGGPNIQAPDDEGVYMIPFNLYPGTYQPSGHVNVSRAREFYITYTSSFLSSTNTADLVVVASAINFLLISDGSAVLRYST
jgi:hypothetical protein